MNESAVQAMGSDELKVIAAELVTPGSEERDHRLDRAGERQGENSRHGPANSPQARLSARLAGGGDQDGPGAGGIDVRGLGGVGVRLPCPSGAWLAYDFWKKPSHPTSISALPVFFAAGWTMIPSTILEHQKALGLDPVDMNILLALDAEPTVRFSRHLKYRNPLQVEQSGPNVIAPNRSHQRVNEAG